MTQDLDARETTADGERPHSVNGWKWGIYWGGALDEPPWAIGSSEGDLSV